MGRAGQRAYAYLLHPPDQVLSEAAYERLRTIGEHTELGAGFKIAMRDLEIRGAGNLLGRDQSGHIAAVGYDLYVQLVAEAVAEMKGEPLRPPVEVTIDVPSDAHLPPTTWPGRTCASRPTGAWHRSPPTPRSTTSAPNGWTASAPCPLPPRGFSPWPGSASSACAPGCARCRRPRRARARGRPVRDGAGSWPGYAPLELPASARVRLRRLRPEAVVKEETHQLVVPLGPDERPVEALTDLIGELVPVPGALAGAESSGAGARR